MKIQLDDLKQLSYFCTRNIQFTFDGQIYRQKDGVAIWSPLGPLLADIFMGKLENEQLSPIMDRFRLYGRYVDDIICVTDQNTNLTDVLNIFNSAHKSIQFTIEKKNRRKDRLLRGFPP